MLKPGDMIDDGTLLCTINPLLHSVEIYSMIEASYRGGARDHAEG